MEQEVLTPQQILEQRKAKLARIKEIDLAIADLRTNESPENTAMIESLTTERQTLSESASDLMVQAINKLPVDECLIATGLKG
jgi:hypothetical protein